MHMLVCLVELFWSPHCKIINNPLRSCPRNLTPHPLAHLPPCPRNLTLTLTLSPPYPLSPLAPLAHKPNPCPLALSPQKKFKKISSPVLKAAMLIQAPLPSRPRNLTLTLALSPQKPNPNPCSLAPEI